MRVLTKLLLAVSIGAPGCVSGTHSELPTSPEAGIPIRRVVLYQNGIGYFERAGTVEGEFFTLQARPSQINDLLKSLTVIDTGRGRAVSVSLPLEQSGDRMLKDLPEQVRNAAGILDVLRVFRGARVEVAGDMGSVAGRVVGIENLETGDGEKVPADWRLTIKTSDGELVMYPLKAISRIEIQDPTLEVGLEQSLDVSLKEGTWKPVTLAVRLAGESPHELRASYIVEMPRWKPAYRIVLGGTAPLLQGWAVVDNVSGEDWRDVELSLVTGTPMSFTYDLHSPQFAERPDLTPRHVRAATAPPPEESGSEDAMQAEAEEPDREQSASGAGAPAETRAKAGAAGRRGGEDEAFAKPLSQAPAPRGAAPPAPPPALDERLEEQGRAAVEAQRVGALFRYALKDRVTVPDRSSTLVAIVNQRIHAEETVYFRPELKNPALASHPYRAVKLKNDTGLYLERGPATIYSAGTFVGEGFLEELGSGQSTFLTFAVDTQVAMDSQEGVEDEGLKLLKISNGQLVAEALRIESTTYSVKNDHRKALKAYVRTLKRPGWKLLDQPAGTVEMPDSFVVPVALPARAKATLKVRWQKRVERFVAVTSDLSTNLLRVFLSGGKAPPEIAKVLEQVLELKAKLGNTEREAARLRESHADLERDVTRVRDNLNVLRKTKGNRALEQKLAKRLAELEEELGKLSGRLVQLSEERAALEEQIHQSIRGIQLVGGS